jgi:hypothetical protein
MQKNNFAVFEENAAMRQILSHTKLVDKGSCSVQSIDQFWAWFEKKLFPSVMANYWSRIDPKTKVKRSGYRTYTYNDVAGGITITQQRRPRIECGGQPLMYAKYSGPDEKCLQLDGVVEDPLVLKGGNVSIPYSDRDSGYTIYLPTMLTPAELKKLIQKYKTSHYFNAQTSKIKVEYSLFNNNNDALGHTSIKIERHLSGYFECEAWVTSIPTGMYTTDIQTFRSVLEVCVVILWLAMVVHFVAALCAQYEDWDERNLQSHAWLAIPRDPVTNEPHIFVPVMTHIMFVACMVFWAVVASEFEELEEALTQSQEEAKAYFQHHSPVVGTHFVDQAWDIENKVRRIHVYFKWYFLLSALNAFWLVNRFLEHVNFQPTLNATTATFRGLFADLAGFGLVFTAVVTVFAFAGFLIFGAQVQEFKTFGSSFVKTWQMSFGTYKIKDSDFIYVPKEFAEGFTFVFRVVVIVLMLKMVMAIIFESYKAVKKSNDKCTGFVDDMRILAWHFCDGCCGGDDYVPPRDVKKALKHSDLKDVDSIGVNDVYRLIQEENESYTMRNAEWVIRKYEQIPPNFTGSKDSEKGEKDKDKNDKEHKEDKAKTEAQVTVGREELRAFLAEIVESHVQSQESKGAEEDEDINKDIEPEAPLVAPEAQPADEPTLSSS